LGPSWTVEVALALDVLAISSDHPAEDGPSTDDTTDDATDDAAAEDAHRANNRSGSSTDADNEDEGDVKPLSARRRLFGVDGGGGGGGGGTWLSLAP
jgi:hypothetical protein